MFKKCIKGTNHRWSIANSAFIGAIFSLVLIPSPSAIAQDQTKDESGVLEEILVTSRRFEESLEDAPVAVNVMSQDFIKSNRIERADDIMNFTPGATWESFSKMQPVASMRGMIAPTPGNASSEASIQTVVDNVVITKDFMKSPPLFDLARVEVLRGPQGTAFGRNASVGLIHFVTARPTQEDSKSFSFTAGSDELFEIDGHINTALSSTSAFRFSFNHDQQDGPMESISTGEGLDGDQNTAIRLSYVTEPSDTFSAYVKLEYSQDRDQAPVRHGYQQPDGSDCSIAYVRSPPYKQTYFDDCSDPFKTERSVEDSEFKFETDRDILTFAAELVWDLENDLTLTSITGYMDGDTHSLMDLAGTPNDVSFQEVANDGTSFTQEIRLDNLATGSDVRWLAGIYLMSDEEDRFEENKFQPRDARGGPFVPTFMGTIANNQTDSISVFGEVNYDINDKTTLTYGGRWVKDDKDYRYGVRASGVNRQLTGVPGVGPGIDGVAQVCRSNSAGPPDPTCGSRENPLGFRDHPVSDSWDDFVSKLSISYAIDDDTNFYALWSQGFKSGTFQPDARNKASANIVVEPESSQNFELGIKKATPRSRWSVTGFFMENEDVQTINLVPVGDGFTGLISNVGSVETLGLEVDGTFLVNDNFVLSGNFALLDSEMLDTLDPSGNGDDLSGMRPPGAPEWTFAFNGEYTQALSSGATLVWRADVRGRDDVFNQTSNRNTSPPLRLRPQVVNWGAQLSWLSADDNWSVTAWGKNLNEDVDIENFGPPSPCCSTFAAGFRNKRTYDVTVNYNY